MKGSIGRIITLGRNTFSESVKNRTFLGLMGASMVLLLSSLLLAQLAVIGQEKRVVQDFGLFFISLMGVIIAVTSGVILVNKELEKKTIYTVLARPVMRWELIIGKYFGMLAILFVEMLVLGLMWFLVLFLQGLTIEPVLIKAIAMIFCELMVISAVALMFSSFSTPILSGLMTIAVFIMGRVVYVIDEMMHAKRGLFIEAPWLKPIARFLTSFFPDLSVFNISNEILLNKEVTTIYLLQAFGYAMCWVSAMMVVAILFFRKRDFV